MFEPLAAAVRFLTILPLPGGPDTPGARRNSMAWFPVAGALIGAVAGIVGIVAHLVSPPVAAVMSVATLAIVTGALHIDGLADVFDSAGGQTRERRLEIMRDSRIGTYGTVAIALLISLKIAALWNASPGHLLARLIACTSAARIGPILLAATTPYARREGIGVVFVDAVRASHLLTAAISAGLLGLVCVGLWGTIMLFISVAVVVAGLRWWAIRTIAGVTGDVMGASVELIEAIGLVLLAR